MNALDRPGLFKAVVSDWALNTTKDSQIPVFSVEYTISAMLEGRDWTDWTEYAVTIRGFHYPFKKDGSPNQTTIKQLQEALGWDGTSLTSLQEGNYANKEVQIVVKEDTYEGNTRLQVAWLNPGDYQPSLKQLEPKEVSALASRWDAKLRAQSGSAQTSKAKGPPPKKAAAPQ